MHKQSRDGHLLSVQQDITGLRLFDFDFSPDGVHLLGAATFAREANPLNGLGRATYAAAAGGMAAGDGGSGGYKAASYRLVVMELRASSGRRLVESVRCLLLFRVVSRQRLMRSAFSLTVATFRLYPAS